MACITECRCGCGQTGCGCHETKRKIRGTRRQPVCPACGTVLVLREVPSVAGNPVHVALCPRCDGGHV